jgi:endonuclease/exonuclease/phosphatase family metal-dependent hydrolase
LEKLDRVLGTKELEDFFPHAIVKKLSRDVSDHNPLILSMGLVILLRGFSSNLRKVR